MLFSIQICHLSALLSIVVIKASCLETGKYLSSFLRKYLLERWLAHCLSKHVRFIAWTLVHQWLRTMKFLLGLVAVQCLSSVRVGVVEVVSTVGMCRGVATMSRNVPRVFVVFEFHSVSSYLISPLLTSLQVLELRLF